MDVNDSSMTEDSYNRRQISQKHLELLTQYMERYPPLALASARSREGHVQSKRMWEKIARTLNRVDESVNKSGKCWARYWADLKFKIRRKYMVVQKCQTDGSPCSIHLNPLEKRMVKILTDDEGNLLRNASMYYPLKRYHVPAESTKLKPDADNLKVNDNGLSEDNQSDDSLTQHDTEHITVPDIQTNIHIDVKPDLTFRDPILIPEAKKTIEELKRELVEFELRRQKETYEMEKQFRNEKHELEMSILRLKKQLLVKELKKV